MKGLLIMKSNSNGNINAINDKDNKTIEQHVLADKDRKDVDKHNILKMLAFPTVVEMVSPYKKLYYPDNEKE